MSDFEETLEWAHRTWGGTPATPLHLSVALGAVCRQERRLWEVGKWNPVEYQVELANLALTSLRMISMTADGLPVDEVFQRARERQELYRGRRR